MKLYIHEAKGHGCSLYCDNTFTAYQIYCPEKLSCTDELKKVVCSDPSRHLSVSMDCLLYGFTVHLHVQV